MPTNTETYSYDKKVLRDMELTKTEIDGVVYKYLFDYFGLDFELTTNRPSTRATPHYDLSLLYAKLKNIKVSDKKNPNENRCKYFDGETCKFVSNMGKVGGWNQLDDSIVDQMRQLKSNGKSHTDIAKTLNINKNTVTKYLKEFIPSNFE